MHNEVAFPLVSAVIPTKNRPELVCRAVRSALNQTYKNLEVIVVVDGPDPETVELLQALDSARLRIMALTENVGGGEARNMGVRAAAGKYVALLDDDDEWLPAKVEKQVALAEAHANEAVLVTSTYYIRTDGKPDVVRPCRIPRPQEDLTEYTFDAYCGFNTSTYLCSRQLFLEVPFAKGLPCFQDTDWYLRMVQRERTALLVVKTPLSVYYNPSERSTITTRSTWESYIKYGREHRDLMTRRAYPLFIARGVRCTGSGKEGWNARWHLLAEMFVPGFPGVRTLALFFLFCLNRGMVAVRATKG